MNVADILELVSSVGFPIFAYLLMWKHMTDYETRMQETVEKNTLAVEQLSLAIADLKAGEERYD